ncbi:MAG: EAL domain-containing protein [Gammaproteobacteria bacterium]|nr:EAL domain-containing protein [Gammaproteobacteria bacterium]
MVKPALKARTLADKLLPTNSLQDSLSKVILLTSIVALILSFGSFLIYDQISFKKDLAHQVNAIALDTASNSQPAFSFDHDPGDNQTFTSLQHYPQIRYGAVLNSAGEILSQYHNNWTKEINPRVLTQHILMTDDFIEVSQPIVKNGVTIGQIYLLSDVERLRTRQLELAIVVFTIFVAALTSTIVITRKKIKTIINPISTLVLLFKKIGNQHDFSLRAQPTPVLELNTLVDGFNGMLEQLSDAEQALKKSQQRLSLALLGGGEGLWDLDLLQQQLYLDKHSCKILGINKDETLLSNANWHKMIHPDDRKRFRFYSQYYITQQIEQYNIEFRVCCESNWLWLKLTGKVTQFDQNNVALRMTGTLQDITKQHLAEEQIKLYASVFDNTSDAIVILDDQLRVIAANQAFSNITQFEANEMHHKQLSVIDKIDNFSQIETALSSQGSWSGELTDQRKDGSAYMLELALNAVKHTEYENYNYVVAVFSDITERKRNENELYFMANFDPLTKLPNRAMFHDYFAKSLASAKRHNKIIALLFIDLDKFKQVNDTLGHDAGDELLIQAAHRMKLHLRDTDLLARLSGDEFTIILENITNLRQAETVARKILQDFQQPFTLKKQCTHIGTSIGISTFPNDANSTEELLKQSDTAMYYAKSNGRNNFHFFDQAMNVQAERRNLIEHELHYALERQQISVYYQPKVDTNNFKILGFEALARWSHPVLGNVPPSEFIPVAEDAGLIKELGQFIFTTACLQLKEWHSRGFNDLQIAINVSAREFQLSDYPLEIAKIIKEIAIDPRYIELELTESIVMENPEKTTLMLDVIKNLGVSLSIDDFGTGYSSLCYLRKLPVDVLKVDQSFVRELDQDNSAAIARAIVSMAHSLKLKVVAEGVETAEQLSFFQQQQCEYIQGFYFSEAVTGEQSYSLLTQQWQQKFVESVEIELSK